MHLFRVPSATIALSASILAPAALAMQSAPAAAPPPTERRPVTDVVQGVEITDPYRWLEGDNSDPTNMGAMTEEVAAWTDAQNAYTRSVLDNLPGREQLAARIQQLMEVGSVSAPIMRGNRYFYSKREGDQDQPIIYMREGHDGAPKMLLDPTKVDETGLATISWFAPDPDGKLLAFGMYRAGDENSTLYVMDVDAHIAKGGMGGWLADEIPGKVNGVDWLPDSSGFFYGNLASIEDPYSGQVKFHVLGTHHRQDPVLVSQRDLSTLFTQEDGYDQDDLKRLETTYGPWAGVSRDGRWLLLGYATDTRNNDLWVVDLDRWMRTREPVAAIKKPILVGEKSESWGPIIGDTLYMKTDLDAPNGRIVAVDLNNPARENWKEIVPQRDDATLQSVSAARGILAVDYLQNAASKIELFDAGVGGGGGGGASLGAIPLPGIGTAGIATEPDRTEAFLTFTSYNEPTSIYRVDLKTGQRALWERPDVPVDPSTVEVKQVWYSSKDGTRVSMFIVHKKGLALDGNNPTLLYGYGGFDISMTPYFSATLFPFYEQGGVFAVANLRGGGEYGQEWHDAGKLENKQNVFDDFIAAGEWLVENGYTRPERLACAGGSNGGLLTGAVLTQRPDLFAAVISAVPLLDMVRYQKFLMARYWVPEYGSAEDPEQFKYLYAYSPYHHVKQGTKYPAVLFTAGENDARVHPMHARKMTAAMQWATASDPAVDPILIRVERDAGHGAGKPLHLRVSDVVDERIFVMWQLGMLGK